ncbi:putative gustatory receptor 28b [Vespula maculifrons]|uniref:Gustatory receptor 28b n=1 Tax=Vespula maculifrons TaxID=7453 RepID=A0ABD2CPS8_VESMC
MLTTTIDSPQHKRVLRMRKNDSLSFDIHQKYKLNEDVIKIKKAKEIHLELIKCARNTNDAYNLHILMSIPATFIFIISLIYHIYYYLMAKEYRTQPIKSYIYLYWISYFGLKVITVCYICATTVTEIRDFTLQLIQNPLSFTSYGFFDLGYTLIRSMIGTVTTYLIILIQVGDLSSQVHLEICTMFEN